MGETSSLITHALPPILTSIGGFFILLFFGFGKEDKQKRLMAAALLVLLVWSVYIGVMMAGEKLTLFSPYITLTCLILSILAFLMTFYLNLKTQLVNDTSILIIFVVGILLSTSGFVNYFGMKGKNVVAFNSKVCSKPFTIQKVVSGSAYSIKEVNFFNETGSVFDNDEFKDTKEFYLKCENEIVKSIKITAFDKSSRGLGKEYIYDQD